MSTLKDEVKRNRIELEATKKELEELRELVSELYAILKIPQKHNSELEEFATELGLVPPSSTQQKSSIINKNWYPGKGERF